MNGEIPSVPITTLAGVSSLLDLLPEMPLPSPLPQTLSNKSLLFHPRVAEEAQRLLTIADDNLLPQLVHSISQTSSKHIDLKDQFNEQIPLEPQNAPMLLAGILMRKPEVFNGKHEQTPTDWTHVHRHHHHSSSSSSSTHQSLNLHNSSTDNGLTISASSVPTPPTSASAAHVIQSSDSSHPHSQQHHRQQHMFNHDSQHNTSVLYSNTNSASNTVSSPSSQQQQLSGMVPLSNTQQPQRQQQTIGGSHSHVFEANHDNRHVGYSGLPSSTIPNNNTSTSNATLSNSSSNNAALSNSNAIHNSQQHLTANNSVVIPSSIKQPQVNLTNMNLISHQIPVIDLKQENFQSHQQQPVMYGGLNNNVNANSNIPKTHLQEQQSQMTFQAPQSYNAQQQKPNLAYAAIATQQQNMNLDKCKAIVKLEKLPPLLGNSLGAASASATTQQQAGAAGTNSGMRDNKVIGSRGTSKNYVEESGSESDDENLVRGARRGKASKPLDKKRSKPVKGGMDLEQPDSKKRRLSNLSTTPPYMPTDEELLNNDLINEVKAPMKIRRVERMLVPVLEKLGGTALSSSTNTYHRFLKIMDVVLDNMEYVDRNDIELDDDGNVPSELLIPKHQLSELCSEAAKLKALGAMDSVPSDKTVKLLTILEINIRDGSKVSPLADPDESEEENRLWLELTMESLSRGILASLTALHILTSQNMPKKAYLEDLIDRIVIFTKFQLQNTIYPTFDPVYRIDPRGKDGFGSSKKKRAHAREVREKNMISFYSKTHEVVGLLAELLDVQVLTDTTVLHLSTLGVSPFFVENVSELQLSALKLVTAIFTQYEKHRRLLLDDILASIARLPSSKRSLRTFKLGAGSDSYIQMLTALVLQLIQCVTYLPEKFSARGKYGRLNSFDGSEAEGGREKTKAERDTQIGLKFETAMRTAANFLSVFLSKCGSKSEECDYRILFENFVQDLLSTVNKPQWPASELLLSLLGTLLVKNLGNKTLDVGMRVSSLEYLGVAASRLRKDAVSANVKMSKIDRIIADIKAEEPDAEFNEDSLDPVETDEEKITFLQRILLDYLAVNGQSDPALMHARHFYISSWWKSAKTDIEKSLKGSTSQNKSSQKKSGSKKKKGKSSEDESDSSDSDVQEISNENDNELNSKVIKLVDKRRNFLLSKIRPFSDPLTSRKTEAVQTFVDPQSAELITRYLASKRPFSASFDFFLTRILSVSMEQTVAIRTKALKCLTMVVEADASVLARPDMQLWVRNSFLDQSTAVREAAVDLIGKYVLSCPDLIDKYYETLSIRILDTGVSVRKRVIKILRDICVECPDFPKIPEICVKMIRRVNDEDGIRKLVMEVFQNMWFTPVRDDPLDQDALLRKVSHITDVVASCEKIGLDFFEQLLLSLFKPKDDREDVREKLLNLEPPKSLVMASAQIVDCLVEHVLRTEEDSTTDPNASETQQSSRSRRFVACVATLLLFAKIRPQLLILHASTLQGYLSLRTQNPQEVSAIANIAYILELVVPLLVNPSESFMSQLEEDCVKLIFKNEKNVIEACIACLGSVVNKITRNYKLIRDVFRRFHYVLLVQVKMLKETPGDPKVTENRPLLRRAVYTIGLFFRYFDFTNPDIYAPVLPAKVVEEVFQEFLYLLNHDSTDLQFYTLQAVGNLCIRHYDYMLGDDLKRAYQRHLSITSDSDVKLKAQALSNIQLYLVEEELRMIRQDQEWGKHADQENIKEMGDVTSGMASTIVQIYLKQILESFLHSDLIVRLAAVRVIQLVLQQGLVHPIQIVPYLICMSTDEEPGISATADRQLQDMEKKHPQFVQSQLLNGIRLSLQLQRILKGYKSSDLPISGPSAHLNDERSSHLSVDPNIPIVRGFRIKPKETTPVALNGFVYSLLRGTKPQRRAIALSLLKQFDEQTKTQLFDLLYYADTLAYFPYQVVDEPLFLIHHVDIRISVTGSNLLQAFKESLLPINPPQNISNPPVSVPSEISVQPVVAPTEAASHTNQPSLAPEPEILVLDELTGNMVPLPTANSGLQQVKAIAIQLPQQQASQMNSANKVADILEDDDDEDVESLLKRIPENSKQLEEFTVGCQGCLLLLMLKQHLKDSYGITDTRITAYSPSDASKTFERPVTRRATAGFDPKCTISNLKTPPDASTAENRRALIEQYLHFKQLMLRIDPEEGDEDGQSKPSKIRIDQSLFTNPTPTAEASGNNEQPQQNQQVKLKLSVPAAVYNKLKHGGSPGTKPGSYAVANQSAHRNEQAHVPIPKLRIVPLKFGNTGGDKKLHNVKTSDQQGHHHHKHKKSKHKKKKKYAVSDDDDTDNTDSDPDFRI